MFFKEVIETKRPTVLNAGDVIAEGRFRVRK